MVYLLKGKRLYVTSIILVLILDSFISVYFTEFTKNLVNSVVNGETIISLSYIGIGLLIMVGGSIFEFANERIEALYIKGMICDLRKSVIDGLLNTALQKHLSGGVENPISTVLNDIKMIEESYIKVAFSLIGSTILILFSFIMLVRINLFIALVTALLVVATMFMPKKFQINYNNAKNNEAQSYKGFTSVIKNIFDGIVVVKTFSIEDKIAQRVNKYSNELEEAKKNSKFKYSYVRAYSSFISILLNVVVIYIGVMWVEKGIITLGELIATTQLLILLINPIYMLKNGMSHIGSVKMIKTRLDKISHYKELSTSSQKVYFEKFSIDIEGVSFKYGEKNVLHDISLCLEEGKKYALIGRSGSGKSTLLKLISKQISVDSGVIRLGGKDYDSFDAKQLYEHLSIIGQDVFVFEDTVIENIRLYQDYSNNSIEEVLNKTKLSNVMKDSSENFSRKNDLGFEFSGGEKQRISIARALIKKNNIILCDESLSALDEETSDSVNKILTNLENITVLTVTHDLRKEILDKYDEIIVLEKGSIVFKGIYNELVKSEVFV